MDPNQVESQIRQMLGKGTSREKIIQNLLSSGASGVQINEAFNVIDGRGSKSSPLLQAQPVQPSSSSSQQDPLQQFAQPIQPSPSLVIKPKKSHKGAIMFFLFVIIVASAIVYSVYHFGGVEEAKEGTINEANNLYNSVSETVNEGFESVTEKIKGNESTETDPEQVDPFTGQPAGAE